MNGRRRSRLRDPNWLRATAHEDPDLLAQRMGCSPHTIRTYRSLAGIRTTYPWGPVQNQALAHFFERFPIVYLAQALNRSWWQVLRQRNKLHNLTCSKPTRQSRALERGFWKAWQDYIRENLPPWAASGLVGEALELTWRPPRPQETCDECRYKASCHRDAQHLPCERMSVRDRLLEQAH